MFLHLGHNTISFHFWLVFCGYDISSGDCEIIVLVSSVCPLIDEDKRFVQAPWWEGLAVGKTRSCSCGQGQAQIISNPVFC